MLLYVDSQKNDLDSNEDNKAAQAGKSTGEKYRNYSYMYDIHLI